MSRKSRVFYFILAIIIFFLSAVSLLYYANGWRFDFNNHSFAKVGAITLQSEPRSAEIILNGIKVNSTTPSTIRNILPGTLQITLQKNGYLNWSKTLTVVSGTAYQLDPIILLKNQSLPKPLAQDQFDNIKVSSSSKYLCGQKESTLKILDLTTSEYVYSNDYLSLIKNVDWSPLSDNLLIETANNKFIVLNPAITNDGVDLASLISTPIISVQWSTSENDIVFAYTGQGVYRLNTFQLTSTLINDDPNVAYITDEFFFTIDKNQLSIYQNFIFENNLTLENDHQIIFHKLSNDWISLTDKINNQFWLYNTKTNKILTFTHSIAETPKLFDNSLLFFNKFEIWMYNFNSEESRLLLRTSDQITSVAAVIPGDYIAYAKLNGGLNIMGYSPVNSNAYQLSLDNIEQIYTLKQKGEILVLAEKKPYLLRF